MIPVNGALKKEVLSETDCAIDENVDTTVVVSHPKPIQLHVSYGAHQYEKFINWTVTCRNRRLIR